MHFLLGTHMPSWLWHPGTAGIPLFVSHRRLARRRTALPRATTRYAVDSGAYTELATYGRWQTTPQAYIDALYRYAEQLGPMTWAAPQDRLCDPTLLDSIAEHTGRRPTVTEQLHATVDNYCTLRQLAPDLPWIPVLQGWHLPDYEACADLYAAAGVDLHAAPLVGLGSIVTRQGTAEAGRIVHHLARTGLPLHGFGVKATGLQRYAADLASADSISWSYAGRRRRLTAEPAPDCHPADFHCQNCLTYALHWRRRMLAAVDAGTQLALTL